MTTQSHVATAQDFLEASHREFAAGDTLQGSEKLWGAAAHAIMAVARQRGWPHGKHGNLRTIVRRLYQETGDEVIRGGFVAAQQFHSNFYHDFMEDDQFESDRPLVGEFVAKVLALVVSEDGQTPSS